MRLGKKYQDKNNVLTKPFFRIIGVFGLFYSLHVPAGLDCPKKISSLTPTNLPAPQDSIAPNNSWDQYVQGHIDTFQSAYDSLYAVGSTRPAEYIDPFDRVLGSLREKLKCKGFYGNLGEMFLWVANQPTQAIRTTVRWVMGPSATGELTTAEQAALLKEFAQILDSSRFFMDEETSRRPSNDAFSKSAILQVVVQGLIRYENKLADEANDSAEKILSTLNDGTIATLTAARVSADAFGVLCAVGGFCVLGPIGGAAAYSAATGFSQAAINQVGSNYLGQEYRGPVMERQRAIFIMTVIEPLRDYLSNMSRELILPQQPPISN